MCIHNDKSSLADKTVKIISGKYSGSEYRVEDWWDRLGQGSWMFAEGNPACLQYAIRSSGLVDKLPLDNEVLYGKIGCFGHLIHISEVEEIFFEGDENK